MAVPKPQVPKDSEATIRARMQQQPGDFSTVLVKDSNGQVVVQLRAGMTHDWNGVPRPCKPMDVVVDAANTKELKTGMLEAWEFGFINEHPRRMGEAQAREGWVPPLTLTEEEYGTVRDAWRRGEVAPLIEYAGI